MSKERLTDNNKELIKCVGYTCEEVCHQHPCTCTDCPIEQGIIKLAEYEDLEEQGLLLRLPCKVGDDLYWIAGEDEDGNKKPTIQKFESEIKHITITENEIWVNAEDEAPTSLDVLGGEYALLTYEEAEEKLRELEGKYDG